MNTFRYLLLISLVMSLPLSAAALDLNSAIGAAKKSNPDLRKLQMAVDISRLQQNEIDASRWVKLNLSADHYLDAKYSHLNVMFNNNAVSFPTGFPQTQFSLNASVLLFDGSRNYFLSQAANAKIQESQLEWQFANFQVEENVKIRFYQALAAIELAKVSKQNITTLESHLSLVEAQEKAGLGTRVDVLRIESQLEEAKADRDFADDMIVIKKRQLGEILGDVSLANELEGRLPEPQDSTSLPDFSASGTERLDIQAQHQKEALQRQLEAASGTAIYPSISFFARENWDKFGNFDPAILPTSTFDNSYSYGVHMNWSILDGGQSNIKQEQNRILLNQTLEATKQLDISAQNDLDLWTRKYRYSVALYRARQRSILRAQESVRLATLAARAGLKRHSEVLDAELDLFKTRAGLVQAQADAAEAMSHIELAVGHSLTH